MVCVFFQIPLQVGATTTSTPLVGRAATAAAEVTNTVVWLTEA